MTAPAILEIASSGVATLTLNRPDRGNRHDGPMLAAIMDALAAVAADPAVRCLVLRGAGRHFCVGADIGGDAAAGGPGLLDVLPALDTLPVPVVAVVQGGCIGGGAAFAACCDIVLASRAAFFAIPEVRLGFAPLGLIALFQRAIGARALRRYALSGERISADVALRIGLASELFDDEATALPALLEALLLGGPDAMRETKAFAAALAPPPPAPAAPAFRSPEALEGVAAFREKRRPAWHPASIEHGRSSA